MLNSCCQETWEGAIQVRFESDSRAIRMNLERFGRIGIVKTQYFGAIRPSPVFPCIILIGEKGGRIGPAVKQLRFLEFYNGVWQGGTISRILQWGFAGRDFACLDFYIDCSRTWTFFVHFSQPMSISIAPSSWGTLALLKCCITQTLQGRELRPCNI